MEKHIIGGIEFMVTPNIAPVPRVRVSPEFARIQSPDLVNKTNAWMAKFFGEEYPIYAIDKSAFHLSMGPFGMHGAIPNRGKVVCVHVSQWPKVKAAMQKGGAA